MKENKDCKVVQDLLPNYIEHLTSEETNQFIEEHLKNCKDCQEVLDSMKAEIKVDKVQQDDREVEYIKKFNVKFKKAEYRFFVLIYTILAVLIISATVFFGRKYIIFNDLAKKVEENQKANNYYMKAYGYDGEFGDESFGRSVKKVEIWVKDNIKYTQDDNVTFIAYDGRLYTYYDGKLSSMGTYIEDDVLTIYDSMYLNLKDTLREKTSIFTYYLSEAIINGKECYQIRENDQAGGIMYIEKETGLMIRSEHRSGLSTTISNNEHEYQSTLSDYVYEFDCVTDEELNKKISEIEASYKEQIEKIEPAKIEKEVVTKTAKFDEKINMEEDGFNIEIDNISYNEETREFYADINLYTPEFLQVVDYDCIIYDANKNIITTSLMVDVTPQKKYYISKFTQENYNNADFSELINHLIGESFILGSSGKLNNGMYGKYIRSCLISPPNLDSLTIELTNLKYHNFDTETTIEVDKDYKIMFNK